MLTNKVQSLTVQHYTHAFIPYVLLYLVERKVHENGEITHPAPCSVELP